MMLVVLDVTQICIQIIPIYSCLPTFSLSPFFLFVFFDEMIKLNKALVVLFLSGAQKKALQNGALATLTRSQIYPWSLRICFKIFLYYYYLFLFLSRHHLDVFANAAMIKQSK